MKNQKRQKSNKPRQPDQDNQPEERNPTAGEVGKGAPRRSPQPRNTATAGRNAARGPDDLGPEVSGDAANLGARQPGTETPGRRPGGATLRGNPGDAGADAGEGAIDATDATTVTGDRTSSPAMLSRTGEETLGGTGPGTLEPPNDPPGMRKTDYRQGGASGALGPDDLGPDAVESANPTGPAADGDPAEAKRLRMGTGKGAKLPPSDDAGQTNLPGDEEHLAATTVGPDVDAGRLPEGTPDAPPILPKPGAARAKHAGPDKDTPRDFASWKPGSDAASAHAVGSDADFGVPVGAGPNRDRDYVSENTRRSDPGAAKPRASEFEGVRTAGAGADYEGEGSGSGGDVDPDFIGVGTGGSGIAASGELRRPPGPDDSDGSSNEMASGAPARGAKEPTAANQSFPPGSFVQGDLDMQTGPEGEGADTATNPMAQGDDSFASEISRGEAAGEDEPISPSSDTQGLSQEDNQLPKDVDSDRDDQAS